MQENDLKMTAMTFKKSQCSQLDIHQTKADDATSCYWSLFLSHPNAESKGGAARFFFTQGIVHH